jgi:hypothetical protein
MKHFREKAQHMYSPLGTFTVSSFVDCKIHNAHAHVKDVKMFRPCLKVIRSGINDEIDAKATRYAEVIASKMNITFTT